MLVPFTRSSLADPEGWPYRIQAVFREIPEVVLLLKCSRRKYTHLHTHPLEHVQADSKHVLSWGLKGFNAHTADTPWQRLLQVYTNCGQQDAGRNNAGCWGEPSLKAEVRVVTQVNCAPPHDKHARKYTLCATGISCMRMLCACHLLHPKLALLKVPQMYGFIVGDTHATIPVLHVAGQHYTINNG